jgi:hypothetical protein
MPCLLTHQPVDLVIVVLDAPDHERLGVVVAHHARRLM